MLTRNKKLKDYGIPAEDIEKLNTMLKDFPAEYGYLLSSAALSACPKNTVIADMVIENILHRKSYRKISKERYIPMNPKDFYGYRRKAVAVLYERMRLLGIFSIIKNYYRRDQMSKWDVSVSMRLSIDYDGIIAETKEEAIEIAKSKALEDIDYNNCDCDTGDPIVYCCLEEES